MNKLKSTRYRFPISVSQDGRIYIKCPEHPYANNKGFILLSHVIVESTIGRFLKPEEIVHHKDGNRWNNNPNNLTILKGQSQHAVLHNRKRISNESRTKLENKKWLIQQYIQLNKTTYQIADELNCCWVTVKKYLKTHNIPLRKYTVTETVKESHIKTGLAQRGLPKKFKRVKTKKKIK